MIFYENGAWTWSEEKAQDLTFFKGGERQKEKEDNILSTPPASPRQQHLSPSSSSGSSSPPTRRYRSLHEIYQNCDVAYIAYEPQKYEEAVKDRVWRKAMDEEINMIEKNKTWQLVDKPKEKQVIGLKWVYKTKFNKDGSIQKYKARLVAKGYSQQAGIDFTETFALLQEWRQ